MNMDERGWKLMKGDESGWKWMRVNKINENGWKLIKGMKMDESRWKWLKVDEMNETGWKWMKLDDSGWKYPRAVLHVSLMLLFAPIFMHLLKPWLAMPTFTMLLFQSGGNAIKNKLAKLGDAIAISKSETITHWLTHSLTGVGAKRCYAIAPKTLKKKSKKSQKAWACIKIPPKKSETCSSWVPDKG